MLQKESRVVCVDNSGIHLGKILRIRRTSSTRIKYANMGDFLKFSIRKFKNLRKYVRGKIHIGLLMTVKCKKNRQDGSYINFSKNSMVLINVENNKPLGTRVYGPLSKEVFIQNYGKDFSRLHTFSRGVF